MGHAPWLFLLPYLLQQIPHSDRRLALYLLVLSLVLAVSLVFDLVDV